MPVPVLSEQQVSPQSLLEPDLMGEVPEQFRERRRRVRRRADRQQGRSLEILGHAVEYLVDSRVFGVEPSRAKAEREAVQILMRASRMVFSECAEVKTIWDRLAKLWEQPRKQRREDARHAGGWLRL